MSDIKISELEQAFKDVFQDEEGKISSVDTVYELSENKDYLKIVISIHNLTIDDTIIIHTKFIFKTDKKKVFLTDNSFIYLYDINCVYHKIVFESINDLILKLKKIIESNDFGNDIKKLSNFISSPALLLNYFFKREKITNYSIFDVKYSPKFKTTPCDKTTFDFDININNNYNVKLSISKVYLKDDNSIIYKYYFNFLGEHETIEVNNLENLHNIIGGNIAKILDKKLK